MEEVFQRGAKRCRQRKDEGSFLDAAGDSWILPFFELKKLKVIPCPSMVETPAPRASCKGESAGLLVLDGSFTPKEEKRLEDVSAIFRTQFYFIFVAESLNGLAAFLL